MDRVLNTNIWGEIKKTAASAPFRRAAIAYVTQDLVGFKSGDVLVVNASEKAIRSGQTDAKLLRDLHSKGVKIYSRADLHSKVIFLGRSAIVGSANMSGSGLIEVSVISDRPNITSGVASFIAQLARPRHELIASQIASLCKIKVVRTGWGNKNRRSNAKPPHKLGKTTWILGVNELTRDPPANEQKSIDRAIAELLESRGSDEDVYNWIRWGKRTRFSKESREGDTLIEISNSKKRKRPIVTRRVPILLKRKEKKLLAVLHRIYGTRVRRNNLGKISTNSEKCRIC